MIIIRGDLSPPTQIGLEGSSCALMQRDKTALAELGGSNDKTIAGQVLDAESNGL
jgi:hypothetical protein